VNGKWGILLMALALPIAAAERAARNVIVFLGDAGGLATLNAASIHGYKEPRRLFIQSMPHIALSETSSASSWVTDSAAGMTAIMTGQKTANGVISQSAAAVRGKKDGERLKTVLEYAEERGLATGVVSNSSVLSATPAACYAHVNDRKNLAAVWRDLLHPEWGDGVDVVIGAGLKDVAAVAAGAGTDAAAALRKAGIAWYPSLDAIPSDARRAAVVFARGNFDLSAAAQRAIDILSRNEKGFFLMVESDLHTENIVQGLDRAVALDATIRRTAERMAGTDTLILFTADHSYDFRVHDGDRDKPLFRDAESAIAVDDQENVRWENLRRDDDHTGEEVLVAALGPGAERVRGILSNTSLFGIMMAAYGWSQPAGPVDVRPAFATDAVGEDPDDPAIWVHPSEPARSLILATDKTAAPAGAIFVFGLDGKLRQKITGLDRPNNIDVEYGLRLGGRPVDIAVVTERYQRRLRVFRIAPDGGEVTEISSPGQLGVFAGAPGEAAAPMGIALYKRPRDGAIFAIVSPKEGPRDGYLAQYRLEDDGAGRVRSTLVRRFGRFSGTGEIEAVAVDDTLGFVYYADEGDGIHKYHADPDRPDAARELAHFGQTGFAGDREGIAIYAGADGAGYIVCTDQIEGNSRYNFYRREGAPGRPHDHSELVKTVRGGADSTDGLEITSANLGPRFRSGMMVVMNSGPRNFLVFTWDDIAKAGAGAGAAIP
jgi:alkaline phosphatase/myo-inositol-hexaphosphate 3-phosphohydrolase